MPGIIKGHFPFDGNNILMSQCYAPLGETGEAEGLSDKAYNLWLYT